MNILVILAHPYNKSLNYAIYERVIDTLKANNHTVIAHDLYAENFDPVLKGNEVMTDNPPTDKVIRMHARDLQSADGIIIVHPTWWGQMPAILKGWIDRVIKNGIAFTFIEDEKGNSKFKSLVKAKIAIVINTSNSSKHKETEVLGNALHNLWQNSIFKFLKIETFYQKVFRMVSDSTYEIRVSWLDETENIINTHFPV